MVVRRGSTVQRSSRKIFAAHYACRNAALNLTPVTGTTNGFIFQIINSLIESWGVRLTWFDCKFVGRDETRAPLKTPSWEGRLMSKLKEDLEMDCISGF